jgi:hypothetical protein
VAGEVTGHRRRVHDVAVPVLEQVRQERPVTVDHPPEVDAHDPPPLGELDRGVAAHGARHTCVVAHQVDPIEAGERGVPEAVDGVGVGHVGDDREGIDARSTDRGLASSSLGASTSASTTCMPAAAKRSAMARPMPLAAPVITAVLPLRSRMAAP